MEKLFIKIIHFPFDVKVSAISHYVQQELLGLCFVPTGFNSLNDAVIE